MSVGGNGPGDVDLEVIRNVTATGDYMVTKLNSTRSNVKEIVKEYTALELTDEEAQLIKTSEQPAITINEVVSARANIGWTSLNHTGVDVPLYAYGPGAELFYGLHENTDLPVLMAEAFKIKFTPGK